MKRENPWVRWGVRVLIALLVYVGLSEISSYVMYESDCAFHPDHIGSCQAMFWHPFWGFVYCGVASLLALRFPILRALRAGRTFLRQRSVRG
jgi:hypothetical protein